MKKIANTFILSLVLITCLQTTTFALEKPTQDSEELRLQDMLMSFLSPYIGKDLNNYYYPKIFSTFSPAVAPWKIEVIETKRVNGFRGFIFEITFEIEPTDGGHWVPIGKDRMTYEISYGPRVKLINHTHLATYTYPPE
ncbi:DUF3888 domain-containing protein [Paenibacillus sp. BC26]|uniref:DUF3888 domain-containing protein n=1 Tax=Paenibacillus sp. BC26 TaxID=1881032 RepID=UPI0008E98F7A|nr:DUF3888 domain-containing protein [Paenibacillus sp. BC26]SFS76134.1 Protein of unknown function [Paenibacillus sp. BC26]